MNKWIVRISVLLSLTIIFLLFYTGSYNNIERLFTIERLWANDYLPGWPNSTCLVLAFSTFIIFKNNMFSSIKKTIIISLFGVATILTTSRSCIIALAIVLFYFLLKKRGSNITKIVFVFAILILLAVGITLLLENAALSNRMFVTWDRLEIMNSVFNYLKEHLLFGYGGNSYDVVFTTFGPRGSYHNWKHTHNTILELLLRFGIVGATIFIFYIISIFNKMKDRDCKFMFLLLWILSLFQIYFRNFNFILMLMFLISYDRDQKGDSYVSV